MGQHGSPHTPNTPEKEDLLTNLDAHIARLENKIATLVKEMSTLDDTRVYILSNTLSNCSRNPLHNRTLNPHQSVFPQTHPTASTVRNPPSSLRHQAILQHARRHERSPTSPPSSGLLSSDEAAFRQARIDTGINNSDNAVESLSIIHSVEGPPAPQTHVPTNLVESSISPTSDTSVDSNGENGQDIHWARKRSAKRKLQDNAEKAMEARRRKLSEC